jgi:F420-dependent oxidoreductase-like protein
MRIGLSGGAASADKMIDQAVRAEAEGFSSLWYASAVGGDPLVAMTLAGRATQTIELGTSVLQTYTCHPVLQANRAASVAEAMGRDGFTLGIGPSHEPAIEGAYGLSYEHPGRHTEEYVRVLAALLAGETVSFEGEEFRVHAATAPTRPVPVLLSALAPRLLRVAGELTDGTILWMANAKAIETHVAPRIGAAAQSAGRGTPRIVAGLPVAVHDDVAEARETAATQFAGYGVLPNYRRILDLGGAEGSADAAIVGDEAAVTAGLQGLFDAGATDVWAAIFPVGADRSASRRRTRDLLAGLVG